MIVNRQNPSQGAPREVLEPLQEDLGKVMFDGWKCA